jgi:perosamine synthetase
VNRPLFDKKDIVAFVEGHFKQSIPTLENVFRRYIGMEFALFTSSCRSALYITYKALKLEGEVITQPLTCSIALLPMTCCGLKPYFVDIDPHTYNIDPEKLNESITNHTCAIQVIHLAGNPCDMTAIKEIAEDHNLILIEDCAQSLGAEHHEKKVGSFGDISCFSFTKNVYGVGGGMILTNNKDFLSRAMNIQQNFPRTPVSFRYYRLIRNLVEQERNNFFGDLLYGILLSTRDKVVPDDVEICKSMEKKLHNPTHVESAVLLSQIEKIDSLIKNRIKNVLLLNKEFEKAGMIKIQATTNSSTHVYTKYIIETECDSLDMIRKLHEKGIDAKHLEDKHGIAYQIRFDIDPYYAIFKSVKNCKNYLQVHDHVISLPMSPNMTMNEVLFIAKQVNTILENK